MSHTKRKKVRLCLKMLADPSERAFRGDKGRKLGVKTRHNNGPDRLLHVLLFPENGAVYGHAMLAFQLSTPA